jgi:hypothetical protein
MGNVIVAGDREGGTPEADVSFRGQLEIVRMKRRQTLWGVCSTWCMLYLVYAEFGVCCSRCMLHSVYAALSVTHHDGMER